MSFKYRLVANSDRASITVIADGQWYVADSDSHPNINEIIDAAVNGDERVVDLFDVQETINREFSHLSERVSVSGDEVYLDGDPAPKALSDAIVAHMEAGVGFKSLVAFLERLSNNPSESSRQQLYNWLEANDGFTITEKGYLIGYKGVARDSHGNLVSRNSGRAIVDGVEVRGQIPNDINSVVEMPRSEVQDDSSVGCSYGLHVGTYEYAKGWATSALLEVLVDPRDVVSVPVDCGAQKLRTCRYTVLDVIDKPHDTPIRGFEPQDVDYMDTWGDHEDDHFDHIYYGFEAGNLGW